jgi:hypothetical protein
MSDFPPTSNLSVINPSTPGSNTSKNRKKKNKKKAKKQGLADPATPSEISSPALTDNESLTASALPAAPIEPPTTTEYNTAAEKEATLPVPKEAPALTDKSVEQESLTPVALPSAPIEESVNKIPAGGPVGIGAAGATAMGAAAVATKLSSDKSTTSGVTSLPEPLPLSDNVKHCIKSAVASGSIDALSIVKKIVKNVEAGDYKAKAALPPKAAGPATPSKNAPAPLAKNAPVTPVKDLPPKDNFARSGSTYGGKSDTVKKAVGGAGAAVAGAGAAVAAKTKGSKGGDEKKGGDKSLIVTDKSNLSENVQHCIQSVVNAPSIDIYGIIKKGSSNDVKCPEPAVGGTAQPVMPSSTQTADAINKPKADAPTPAPAPATSESFVKKFKENRKSSSGSRKKKNCIIL